MMKFYETHLVDLIYIEKLNHVIEEFQIDFLHSQPDSEVKVISENREKLKTNKRDASVN